MTPDTQERVDLYENEINRFQATIDEDLGSALRHYGFTLYHSLPASKQIQLGTKLGMQPRDGIDFYNLAGVAIEREDYKAAIDLLHKALNDTPELEDALFNLALCHEKMNQKAEAIKNWKKFLEVSKPEDPAENEPVVAHLAELTAQ